MITLYSYWRSSAAYRVRIALNLKGIDYEIAGVNMLKDGGEQHSDAYRAINPQGLVPTIDDDGLILTQSMAIIEYLEEKYPDKALLPGSTRERARARQLANIVACDVHPLNNLRVLKYLKAELEVDDRRKDDWYEHWIRLGFAAFESGLAETSSPGPYCLGESPGLADICLVPQMYNARRFNISLDEFPHLCQVERACLALDAFKNASPEQQPDAVT